MSDLKHVEQALETWKRHRRNGTMPPIRTMEILVGAAREWAYHERAERAYIKELYDEMGGWFE